MADLTPLTPCYTASLFPGLSTELMSLLRSLPDQAWLRPTAAGRWRVRDVVAHLLDGGLRRLASARDGHVLATRPLTSFDAVVGLVNELNAGGVEYAQRLSPRVMSDLLEVTEAWVASYVASLPPHGEAHFPVAWANESRSEHWMDIGREYTERWHHQMQIRDAVGAPAVLLERRWLEPLLNLSVRAFPRAYADIEAVTGSAIVFRVESDGDHVWSIVREVTGWTVVHGAATSASATVSVDADTAWKLLYHALTEEAAVARAVITGDHALAAPLFRARSVMV